jgi:hypothetical protein
MNKSGVEELLDISREATAGEPPVRAPSRLKSRIYSRLMLAEARAGPLRSVSETHADCRGLCVFEHLVRIAPVGEQIKSMNFCRVCHARLAGEKVEHAPIYWPHCPYVQFQNR